MLYILHSICLKSYRLC